MLILLMASYFFFMATKTALVDTTSRVLEIVEVGSDILVDFLVMLARVFEAVAPSSPLEGLSVVVVLVNEMTWAVIRSWHGGSSN